MPLNHFQAQLADEVRLVIAKYRREFNVNAREAWEALSEVLEEVEAAGGDEDDNA